MQSYRLLTFNIQGFVFATTPNLINRKICCVFDNHNQNFGKLHEVNEISWTTANVMIVMLIIITKKDSGRDDFRITINASDGDDTNFDVRTSTEEH